MKRDLRVRLLLHPAGGGLVNVTCKLCDYRSEREQLLREGVRIERATLFLHVPGQAVRLLARPARRKPEARGQGERSEP